MTVKIITYGGIIQALSSARPPRPRGQRHARLRDLAGYTSDAYIKSNPYFGAIIGRYGNRIAKGRFTLDGKEYSLDINNEPNSLHGGFEGFNSKIWTATESANGVALRTTAELTRHESPGDGCTPSMPSTPPCTTGYPGTLQVDRRLHARQRQQPADRLHGDDRRADGRQPHQPRLLEPRRRGLRDDLRPPAAAQRRPLHAGRLDADPDRRDRPGGRHAVRLPRFHAIGERIRGNDQQLVFGRGYDHNWVLDRPSGDRHALIAAARLRDPVSGRVLTISTDRARDPVLLGQLPRRHAVRHERPPVPAGRRARARDPALPRLAEPRRTSRRRCSVRARPTGRARSTGSPPSAATTTTTTTEG